MLIDVLPNVGKCYLSSNEIIIFEVVIVDTHTAYLLQNTIVKAP